MQRAPLIGRGQSDVISDRADGAAPAPPAVEDLLALQRSAGNQAVQRLVRGRAAELVLQRERTDYKSATGEAGAEVAVDVEDGLISAAGTLAGAAGARTPCSGTLNFKIDDQNPKRVVIDTVFSQPEGAGLGGLLGLHLAHWAQARGMTSIGTNLTAPTAMGFYITIGLDPSPANAEAAIEAVSGMPRGTEDEIRARETQKAKLMYSSPLDAPVSTVLAKAQASADKRWKPLSLADRLGKSMSSWFSQ